MRGHQEKILYEKCKEVQSKERIWNAIKRKINNLGVTEDNATETSLWKAKITLDIGK